MIILKPHYAHIDQDNFYTTKLYFDGRVSKDFYMRGSIAWPEGDEEGFALMAGFDLGTKTVIIFEEFPFWTIDFWKNEDGTIRKRQDGNGYHLGLIQFIQDNMTKYKCTTYYWGCQHIDYYTRFATELYKHPMASRRLELIETPNVNEIGTDLIMEKLKTQKFKGQSNGLLDKSVSQFISMKEAGKGRDNKVIALEILMTGFDFQPWVSI